MGIGDTIKVRFLGDDSDLSRAAASAGHSTSRLGSTLKKVGIAAAAALAVGAYAAGKALVGMTKAAIEDQVSQDALARTLKNTTGASNAQIASVEDWISKQGILTGVTDDELRPALQRMAEGTHDVGEAQRLTAIAMDVAAGTGRSLKSVTEALLRAQNGSIDGLSRYGIATKNAKGETMSFDQVVKGMAKTFGGQAAAKANTLQGKMDRLRLVFDETKEAIGYRLIPVLSTLAQWLLTKVGPAVQRAGDVIGKKLGPVARRFGDWCKTDLLPALKKLGADLMPLFADAVDGAGKAFKDAQPFLAQLGDFIVKVLIPGIGKVAKVAIPMMVTQWRIVAKILTIVGKAVRIMWNAQFQPVMKFIIEALARVMLFWGKLFQLIGKVPGFGWVGRVGNDLVNTAGKADRLGDSIKKIPNSHSTKITADTSPARASVDNLRAYIAQFTQQRFTATVHLAQDRPGHNAGGTRSWRGGLTWVGEQGPELISLPRGTAVYSNRESMAMAGAGPAPGGADRPIIVKLFLDGREIHQSLLRRRRQTGTALGLG